MKMPRVAWTLVAIALMLAAPAAQSQTPNQAQAAREHWVGTWATALATRTQLPAPAAAADGAPARGRGGRGGRGGGEPAGPSVKRLPNGFTDSSPQDANSPLKFENETLRQNMKTTIGGERVRVVFSNRFGTTPLRIGSASMALRAKDSAIVSGSARPLTFNGGQKDITIPPRADYMSDAIAFSVPAGGQVTIDTYLPESVGSPESPLSFHLTALTDNYLSVPGEHTASASFSVSRDTQSFYLVARIEVVAPASTGAVVVLGDSTTDGARSSLTNARWPDVLADRLGARPGPRMAVLSAGYGGNSLLRGGGADASIARFDRDVLAQSGATHLLVLQGITDIRGSNAPSLNDMISGHRQLIARARAHGLRVIGATLTPFGNTGAGYTPAQEATREGFNNWVRTSKEYDGFVDFAKLLGDPAKPTQYRAELTSDFVHPSELGCQKMGEFIDLSLFTTTARH